MNRKYLKNNKNLQMVFSEQAIKYDKKSDIDLWKSALFCSRIVGNYKEGATRGLASDMNRSVDTIEDRAHAYMMFEKLCKLKTGEHRLYVFHARRLPYVHLSHFRTMWDLMKKYDLTDAQLIGLLVEIVQAEGELSSRNLSIIVQKHYDKHEVWEYQARKAYKAIENLINHPSTPKNIRIVVSKTIDLLKELGIS